MTLSVSGQRSELGRLLAHRTSRTRLHIDLSTQRANTVLHDGHAWKDFARTALAGVRRATRADARLLVHASCAFLAAEPQKDPLRSLAQAILECEQLALSGPLPAVVVRLGYLYGPDSSDLRAYRTAFRLGRPYWAGPRKAGQYYLHHEDAVSALVCAGTLANRGKTFYATSGPAVPFMAFMDHFARGVGARFPLHVPLLAAPLMRWIVRKEHVQQVALAMPHAPPMPQVPGWTPAVPDYRAGLDQIIAHWQA